MNDNIRKTGTTTVGIKYKNGVVLASESKATMGNLIASKSAKKVYKLSDHIGLTTAGGVGDIQSIVRSLIAEIKLYELNRHEKMSVKAVNTLLSNILQGNRYYPLMAMLIVGGHDKNGPSVFSVDPLGGSGEDEYVSTGSGSPFAYGVLEDKFKPEMEEDEAVQLAVRSIRSARERDAFSGGNEIQVAVIDENGFRKIENTVVEKYSN